MITKVYRACLPVLPDPGRARQTRPPGPRVHHRPTPLPGHRSRPTPPRGRWHPLTCILLVCACTTISGAKSIDELAEWGQRAHPSVLATLGARPRPLGWRHSPSVPTTDRVLARIDGDALDSAIGAYLAGQHQATADQAEGEDIPRPRRPAIALHTVKDHLSWLAGTKKAHYIAVIAKATRAIRDLPERALPFFGISYEPAPSGT